MLDFTITSHTFGDADWKLAICVFIALSRMESREAAALQVIMAS